MMWFQVFAGIIIITVSQTTSGNAKLLFLQTISRHGDRAPLKHYDWDLTPSDFWQGGYSNLTELGKKQNYILGKSLQFMYKEFLTMNPNEVTVNTTDAPRCIESGKYLLSSFYYSETEWGANNNNLSLDSIPVYYQALEEDKYLSLQSDCPRTNQLYQDMYSSPVFLQESSKYQDAITDLFGDINPLEIEIVQDTLDVLKIHNRTLPSWPKVYFEEFSEFADFLTFYPYKNPEMQRLRAGPIVGKFVDDMKRKISGDIPTLKLQMYSVQSALLLTVMEVFGVFINKTPPYCATLILELHGMPNGTNAVRLLYLNSSEPENGIQVPHVLQIKGCSEYCPLGFLADHTQQFVPQDWELECGLTTTTTSEMIVLTVVFTIIIFIIFVGLAYVFMCKRKCPTACFK